MTHDIFISYSNKDKTIAEAVCAKLEEHKIRVWIAPRDINAGQNFARSIINAIDSCKAFVLIWSTNTNASEHILNEINQAFDQGITIIPFRIQEVQPTAEMRYYFGRTHWLDALTPPLEKHIGILVETIQAILDNKREVNPDPIQIKAERDVDEVERVINKTPAKVEVKSKPDFENYFSIGPPRKVELKKEVVQQIERKDQSQKVRSPDVPPQKKRVLISVLAGVLVVSALVTMYILGVFNRPTTAVKTEVSVTSNTPISVTMTHVPTKELDASSPTATMPTLTPLPAWVNEFSGQIMTAIKYREPDFQDDFSYWKAGWEFEDRYTDCPNTYTRIVKEKLHMISDKGCWTWADLPYLDINNFATQIDMNFQQDETYGGIVIKGATDGGDFLFELSYNGQWGVHYCQQPEGHCIYKDSGITSIDPTNPVTITIILTETETAIYVNSIPVYHDKVDKNRIKASHFSVTVQDNNLLEFDNLKIWDLDKIENLSSTSN